MQKFIFFCLLVALLPASAPASDLFGFLKEGCQLELGVPISHQEGRLGILTPQGEIKYVTPAELVGIAHYVLSESAFGLENLSSETMTKAKTFQVKDSDLVVKGFPYQFLDGTIFILDRNGVRRVIDLEEIGRVETVRKLTSTKANQAKVIPPLSLPAGISECKNSTAGLIPVRFLADKIQILETVNGWSRGFKELDDLAERSQFYPRPYLFEDHDSLAFVMFGADKPGVILLPIRYTFNNGEDFRFQGKSSLGGDYDQIGPVARPLNLLKTDLKFHFLHASFEGNLDGISIGSSFFSKQEDYLDYPGERKDTLGDISFNHIALLGADWHRWGLSFGPMFPVFYVQVDREALEATPRKSIPIVRVTWTGERVKFKLAGARGDFSANSNMGKKVNQFNTENGFNREPEFYKINFSYLRGGGEWDISENFKLSSDLIWTKWNYRDGALGSSVSLKTKELALLTSVRKSFTSYVALSLHLLWSSSDTSGNNSGVISEKSPANFNYGGTFEFLF
ncbi:MAG TPA: hypothetical protein VNJ01_11825 [Bacteriovoracaceae bacterium]|nr:hypothetical protein [Bacteriovoracaceae bacterium]